MIRLGSEHPTLEQVKGALDIEFKRIQKKLITEQSRSNKYVRICKIYHEKYFPDMNITEFLITMQQPTTQLEIMFNIQGTGPRELFGGDIKKCEEALFNAHEDIEELYPRYQKRAG